MSDLLAVYDERLRAHVSPVLPAGTTCERDGPLVRSTGVNGRGFVEYRNLGRLEGAALDALIDRQVAFFAARSERFEWKLHGHDRPADLPERLRAAGFRPEEQETVVIGRVDQAAGEPRAPDGVSLREVRSRSDLERIEALEEAVWGESHAWLPGSLGAELAATPDELAIVVAEAGGLVVSAGWIRFATGTGFATLWGGATLPEWRRQGIYRALVAYRANLAAERGFTQLEVDASEGSRPILERLGFVPVTTTTPYVWTPAAEAAAS